MLIGWLARNQCTLSSCVTNQDLLSVLVEGPARTPYEDGLFLFDVQLPNDYPSSPPVFHYVSHCSDRLNPNLYEDGKVCVSLLGTWSGKVSNGREVVPPVALYDGMTRW